MVFRAKLGSGRFRSSNALPSRRPGGRRHDCAEPGRGLLLRGEDDDEEDAMTTDRPARVAFDGGRGSRGSYCGRSAPEQRRASIRSSTRARCSTPATLIMRE